MLHMREFAFYPSPEKPVFGLLFCVDNNGRHWTIKGAPENLRMILPAMDKQDLEVNPALFPRKHRGWPDEWGGRWPDESEWDDT
jgi:hypothetical protein